jgi:hypothetical protein
VQCPEEGRPEIPLCAGLPGVYDGSHIMKALVAALVLLTPLVLRAPPALTAQALIGTWVSTEPILMNLKFSLTFQGSEYLVDCTLGQTIGTYTASEDRIFFTPVKIGINAGDVGKSDTWAYRFVDSDSFTLTSGAISVRLFRKG